MKTKVDNFYKGMSIDAYTLFGSHKCDIQAVRFSLWAPNALKVDVHFLETDDFYGMDKDINGIWNVRIENVKENSAYRYRIMQKDGNIVEKNDPYGLACKECGIGGSVYIDDHFLWEDQMWMQERSDNYDKVVNIYEVHLSSWKQGQTYRSIAKELIAYVKEYHFTHIEFMPLSEYSYDGSWGYLVNGMYAMTSRYGSVEDIKCLINECHKANIGVLFDFVPIHFAKDQFGLCSFDGTCLYEYENEEYRYSEWGSLNYDLRKDEVRSYLTSAASYYLNELHVDGLRVDAISHALYWQGKVGKGENKEAIVFLQRMNTLLKEAFPTVMLIAEDSTAYPNVTKSIEEDGLGFDYKWDMGWMNDTLKYFDKDPIYRKWHHHEITFSMAYFYNERYLLPFSHDEVVHEKRSILNKMWGSYEDKIKQVRLLYTYMFTHPGKKLNFMGNEFGMLEEFSEKKELQWHLLEDEHHKQIQTYIKELAKLYHSYKALHEHEYDYHYFEWMDADNSEENLYSYMRKSEEEIVVVILNMSPVSYKQHAFGVCEEGIYEEVLNSETCIEVQEKNLKIHTLKEECNYKPYTICVDVDGFAGIVLVHKRRDEDATCEQK